jgi:hypothetical protein
VKRANVDACGAPPFTAYEPLPEPPAAVLVITLS